MTNKRQRPKKLKRPRHSLSLTQSNLQCQIHILSGFSGQEEASLVKNERKFCPISLTKKNTGRHKKISDLAYQLSILQNFEEGRELENWLLAEKMVDHKN